MKQLDDNKVFASYENKAKIHKDMNAVLDAGESLLSKRANILHDYFHKQFLIEIIKPKLTDVVLDFGTGIGRLSSFLSNKVEKMYGIDASPSMIEIAQKNKVLNKDTTAYFLYNNLQFPFKENYFHKVFAYWVFASISDEKLDVVFSETRRCLKDKGLLIFFEQVVGSSTFEGGVHKKRTYAEYKDFCDRYNFEIILFKPLQRSPSYAMYYWKKYSFLPKLSLRFLYWLERATINRKKESIEYLTCAFICQKK